MDIDSKLKQIKKENIVLFIYIILIILYYYGNTIEVNYLKYRNEIDKERYRTILYIVFVVVFLISLVYSIFGLNELKENVGSRTYKLEELSVVVNLLALVAIGIYIYIIYKDKDLDLEVTL